MSTITRSPLLLFALILVLSSALLLGSATLPTAHAEADQTSTGYRLVIPLAHVDTTINQVSMTDYEMPSPADHTHPLAYDMSRLQSGLGGDFSSGNLVIDGDHICGCPYDRPVFAEIDKLSSGDMAMIVAPDGSSSSYQVFAAKKLPAGVNWNTLLASDAADLTLLGCHTLPNGHIEYYSVAFHRT